MKKLLATLAVAGLAAGGAATVASADPSYESPCGSSIHQGGAPNQTTIYQSDPGTSGHIGVIGQNGYIEASGDATTQTGGIDGSTAGKEFYGSISGSGVCAGSGATTVTVP